MGASFPGRGDFRSPPYSRAYAAGQASPVNLTEVCHQAKNATSGFVCIATATTVQLAYKDGSGAAVDTGSITNMVAGNIIELPVSAIELTTNVGLVVIAYWHPSAQR